MALESVDYSEEKALKILDIVLQEDKDSKKKSDKDKKKPDAAERNVSFKEPRYVLISNVSSFLFKKPKLYKKKISSKLCFAHS